MSGAGAWTYSTAASATFAEEPPGDSLSTLMMLRGVRP